MNRTTVVAVALASILSLAATPARADLTFDLRAVSGSQVTIHNPKSVAVNHNSVGGWIDFELYAVVTGSNPIATDEGMVKFTGSMLSTHVGHGAAVGNMDNTGDVVPRARRGVLAPFDGPGYQDGTVQNLDSDPELEIGGTSTSSASGLIAARTGGNPYWYQGNSGIANIPLYRFTLPIESVSAQSLSDLTRVHFVPNGSPLNFIWAEDSITYAPSPNVNRPGRMWVNEAVLIHTAQTPEELALIPEPGTWCLGAFALVGLAAVIRRAPRKCYVAPHI
jgi:hypothetical protein